MRRGTGRAQVAVAHSIVVSAWHMLTNDEPYQDVGADWLARRNEEAHTRRLVVQLERLGHTVQLDIVAWLATNATTFRAPPDALTRLLGHRRFTGLCGTWSVAEIWGDADGRW